MAEQQQLSVQWRVGRALGRTVYIGDRLVGLMDTPELAQVVVESVNLLLAVAANTQPTALEGPCVVGQCYCGPTHKPGCPNA